MRLAFRRSSHNQVPLQAITDMTNTNSSMMQVDAAGQELLQLDPTAQMAINLSHMQPATPKPMTLSHEKHSQKLSTHVELAADPVLGESATDPERMTTQQFPESRKDKDIIS